MEGKKLLHAIRLQNLLSYGSEGVKLQLEPLNVLIGPNASGKSNLIEALSLLAAAPRDLHAPFREGGIVEDWLWKGREGGKYAEIQVVLYYGKGDALSYLLAFTNVGLHLAVMLETLEDKDSVFLERNLIETLVNDQLAKVHPQQSVLSHIKDPSNHPQLTYVGNQFAKMKFFRGWSTGRGSVLRRPQEVSLPDDFLLEDGSNLGLILNDLQNRRETKRLLLEKLKLLYEGVEDITTKVQGGTIQVFFHEEGLHKPVPAARLSDGTLHYLCLLTVLLHPEPPPLICIEEPELGLHPDIIRTVGKLLIDASRRTQLIVTTHSETLVSALSETPESVIICERDEGGTKLRRLEPKNLKEWLDRYLLGELWAMGEIGGNR